MIQICIYANPHGADDSGENGTPVQLRYRVAVLGYRILSKLLSVNHEARRVAVTFYRVRIPCTFTLAPLKQVLRAVTTVPEEVHNLPFNPEYDVLQVSVFFWPDDSTVGVFLLDLKALDPRAIGLRELALDVDDWPSHGEGPNRPPSPSTTNTNTRATALRRLFSGLDEILFTTTVSLGRVLVPARPRRDNSQREILFLNRAMPVCAHTPAFTRISRNSRPVIEREDLRRVFTRDTGPDLHAQALAGRALLAYLGAQSEDLRAVRMSWLLAFSPSKEIYSREKAEEFMRAEEARWVGSRPGPSFADELERVSGRYLSEVSDQRKDANTKSDSLVKNVRGSDDVVFGYWQFPLGSNELVDAAPA